MTGGDGIQFETFSKESRIGAEIDADVAVGLVGSLVKKGAKADDAHHMRTARPARPLRWGQLFQFPETPADLELVGEVIVEQFDGLLNG